MNKKERARINKAHGALPSGMSRNGLFQLWLGARRRKPNAQIELHRLLTTHPKIQYILKEFANEHDRIHPPKYIKSKLAETELPKSPWVRMLQKSNRWTSVVSGGLPSLGRNQ